MAAEVVSDSVPHRAGGAGRVIGERPSEPSHGRSKQLGTTGNGYHGRPEMRSRVPEARAPEVGRPLSLSVIMAAFNEERTIVQAVQEILAIDFPCDIELIVVNDGSTDRTPDLLAELNDPRVTVCHHDQNRGKGAALRSAAALATGTYVLPFDADLEYAAEDVARMLDPVVKGRCKVVYGVRLFGYNTVYRSYRYAMGNRYLTRLANVLFDACLSDLHTCLKLIPTELLRSIDLRESGFGLDTEITASLLRIGVRPFEVPVSYFGRSHAEGKKITWRDAVACVWIMMRVRLSRQPGREGIEQFTTLGPHDVSRALTPADADGDLAANEPGGRCVRIGG
jgi:dolichol-phosphate hexosyltransferase